MHIFLKKLPIPPSPKGEGILGDLE